MQQKKISILLSHLNSSFIIHDKGGIKSIVITKLEGKFPYDFSFWANLHLRVVDQKELTLFDQSLSDSLPQSTTTREIGINKQFGVIDHLTVWVYADHKQAFEVELFYDLNYVLD